MECLKGWMVGGLDEVEGARSGVVVSVEVEFDEGRSKGREEVGT